MTEPYDKVAERMSALRNEINICFDRLQVFPRQGLGLNMLSRIGQMASDLQLEINNHIYHESNRIDDDRQLNLDFDGEASPGNGEDAGGPERVQVP